MASYTSFAIAGVGGLGSFIAEHLTKQPGVTVIGLSRKGSSSKDFPSGVSPREVDYADEASVVTALKGVQVVISAVSGAGVMIQPALANAAKKAGVKLFVPSEYGVSTTGVTEGLLVGKAKVQQHLKDIDLPYALFFTGVFSDTIFRAFIGFDIPNKTISITGSGNTPVSMTARDDIGHYIAHVLTHVTPAKLEWTTFRIEGDKKSLNEVVATIEKVKGVKLAVEHLDYEALVKDLGPNPAPTRFVEYLRVVFESGAGDLGKNTNELVPNFRARNLEESIKLYY
jgi:uncharacterized protein YbjT (DUF2867 family)